MALILAQPTHDCSKASEFISKLGAQNWRVEFEIQSAVPDFSGYAGEDVSLRNLNKVEPLSSPVAPNDSGNKKIDKIPPIAAAEMRSGATSGETSKDAIVAKAN